MKLNDIESEWAKDSTIDSTELGAAATNIPKLHAKYHQILNAEKLIIYKQKNDLTRLEMLLEAYYQKTLTQEELTEYGLPPYSEKKYLKPDIPKHIDIHPDVINQKLKIGVQNEKIEYLKDILKMIHGRSFQIRDAIEWAKYSSGAY